MTPRRAFLAGALALATVDALVAAGLTAVLVVAAALLAGLFVAGGLMRMWDSNKADRGQW